MKRIVLLVGLACLVLSGAVASEFEGLETLPQLSLADLEKLDGEALYLGVDRTGKTMTVTSIVPGDYSHIECYTVAVSTEVVRNSDKNLPKNAMVNTNKTIVASNGVSYNPQQLTSGTYNLSATKANVGGMGPGIKIDVAQVAVNQKGQVAVSTDFFVHGIPYDNTNGCVGVKNGSMAKVMTTYQNAVGPKTVSIFSLFGKK
ncbi:MAG: hypothetical protein WCG80_04460 [Spirochaetales bacterium]